MATRDTAFDPSARWLARHSPELTQAIKRIGMPALPRRQPSAFAALTRSITAQQIGTAAASAIWKRTEALSEGALSPRSLLDAGPVALREAGQSRAKISALIDLANKCEDGTIKLLGLSRKSDAAVIEALCQVKGIGPWSAQMFLLFHLRRLDIWPTGDLAVRRGYANIFGGDVPNAKALEPRADAFVGHRSTVAWYCWRSS